MEDQGKRLIIAVVLAMGVWMLWGVLFPPEDPAPKKATPEEVAPAAAPAPAEAPAAPAAPRGPEQELALENGHVRAVFSSYGGGLKSWRLLDKKYEGDPTKGEMVAQPAGQTHVSLATSFAKGSTYTIPDSAEWQGEKLSDTQVRYRYANDQLTVVKTFTFFPAQYLIRVATETTVTSDANQRFAVSSLGFQDPKIEIKTGMGRTPREWKASCYIGDGDITETSAPDLKAPKERAGAVHWGGFTHPYLLIGVSPRATGATLGCIESSVAGAPGLMRTEIVWPVEVVKAGSVAKHEAVAYLGPKFYDKLRESSEVAGFETHLDAAVDFGWFGFIGKPLLWLLHQFYAFAGNWGIAIILLTFLVKLATLYWTTKSMRSMQAMAELKPKIDELQKKYPDDRQRMQTEMMGLYKAHGVNPLAGCLPILMQMPIWLALYKMLSSVGELYHAPFIPGWIEDLTATDPYHILPIVLILTMFGQAKLSPAAVDSTQQKMLMYGMPIFFGVMGFFFPSGLSVYILTNTVLSALHTLYMRKAKKTPVPPAAAVAVVSTAKAAEAASTTPDGEAEATGDSDKAGKSGKNAGRGKRRRR